MDAQSGLAGGGRASREGVEVRSLRSVPECSCRSERIYFPEQGLKGLKFPIIRQQRNAYTGFTRLHTRAHVAAR